MRDLFFVGYLLALLFFAFKRPFIFTLVYTYVDIIAPQRLSYFMLNSVPLSLLLFGLALAGFLLADDKRGLRFTFRQALMLLLLIYCGYTTLQAAFPLTAWTKWDWVWKALVFAIFLPFTLRTRLRIEALVLFLVLCVGTLVITGGIKTLGSGGGYGVLVLLVDDNSGLYEGSTISMAAIAIIPFVLWLAGHGTIFPPDWRVKLFAAALIFAALLIPVGTQARTGLVCMAVLGVLMLRNTKRRFLYLGLVAMAGMVAIPMLPENYTKRMSTIENPEADQSASTRLAVWSWTWDYVKQHPFGGGFDVYQINNVSFTLAPDANAPDAGFEALDDAPEDVVVEDKARAFHSSYFEMLGEQGFPGLILWLMIHIGGVIRMELVLRRYRKSKAADEQWIAPLATALQQGQIIYLVGALFVGIAYTPFIYMLVALQIGLDSYLARRRKSAEPQVMMGPPLVAHNG
ncbi:MAG: putative O-glycosylation ligase, exosortase A system-associated [Parasphingorhabdus sp.]|nr:putative O-glycosylation ligase, exosortase A system-associated [Parasphingorhabdus sp.]